MKIKTKKIAFKQGFTLIELIVVMAVIGILGSVVLVNLNPAKNLAQAANTKQTLSSLGSALAICCESLANGLQTVADGDVCDTGTVANLPNAAALQAANVIYSVLDDCSADNPALDVQIIGHPKTECNAHISVTQDGIFSGGNASTIGTTRGFPAGC
ncbi:MAG: type II secretion system protein [Candidatus Moraniibacteriota bacterium]